MIPTPPTGTPLGVAYVFRRPARPMIVCAPSSQAGLASWSRS